MVCPPCVASAGKRYADFHSREDRLQTRAGELAKIIYIEGLKDYVKIYIDEEPRPLLSLMSLKSLEEQLPAQQFVRVHRSFIVRTDKIKVIERNRIVFGKEYIPISDSYKAVLMEQLARHAIVGKG